ncbi:hypothetical protein E4U17_004493 [Claviceps sp. LM77 group G4]|nr:hypothetical protein E4U17_004493 [Claviceps sp. LM77 group G4]KAG6075103.1 hypothetical protein E4U16_003601 [Claviceps sp. LM84 group G4]KAG6083592.1 hypothetical protein E4U33_004600 [Claviceps sp. LM78 group G4]
MRLLQSLGLAPAQNAILHLFRRSSTADTQLNGLKQSSTTPPSTTNAEAKATSDASASDSLASSQFRDTEGIECAKTTDNMPGMTLAVNHYADVLADKENRPPPEDRGLGDLTPSLNKLSLGDRTTPTDEKILTPGEVEVEVEVEVVEEDPAVLAERAHHMRFIGEALDMARLALRTNETPVGCVLVHNGTIIAKGMNATNVTRNGTRHAEFMAVSALLSYPPKDGPRTTSLKPKRPPRVIEDANDTVWVDERPPDEGNEDGRMGHLYPYGQKFHSDARVSREILRECILYVTVEPCVMCASLLRQLGIKKVYFGAVNDKFGGTGGVFSIHANSLPIREDGTTASAHPTPRPSQLPDGSGTLGTSYPPGGGDGGNVEAGYEIEGGWGRDEAVGLLRRFYVQENGRAPVPRKKEGRAARLAAMMENEDGTPMVQAGEGAQEVAEVQIDQAKDSMDSGRGENVVKLTCKE